MAALVLFSGATMAAPPSGPSSRGLSVHAAIDRVQRETDGKVLAVQTLQIGKRKIYRIKVLTHDGKVRVVQVPADD